MCRGRSFFRDVFITMGRVRERVVVEIVVILVIVVVILVVLVVRLVVWVEVRLVRSLDCTRGRGKASSSRKRVVEEVMELVGVNGIVVGNVKTVVWGGIGGSKISVIFVVVDGVVGAPLDDEATLLDKGLALEGRKGFDTRNGVVGHREEGPLMSGNAGASRQ